jgi:hypothetical protein
MIVCAKTVYFIFIEFKDISILNSAEGQIWVLAGIGAEELQESCTEACWLKMSEKQR